MVVKPWQSYLLYMASNMHFPCHSNFVKVAFMTLYLLYDRGKQLPTIFARSVFFHNN